ncbi:hypothetical protein B9Z19DRAFT_1098635 [Tuber borchii]|uniref:GMC oxidoreductase-domain-containing protein n=1 Tax=Tuber borchii TaxID=42251 RepID=A0A2T7A712_TUBBO|nr:hypothetical protein B9Z19DRAFT_1098635 [Tuber borchii]
MMIDPFVSKGILLDPDMFSIGDNPHGCGHVVRTTYQGESRHGMEVIDSDGKKHTFTIRRKVIASRGSYCSLAILLRSRVGLRQNLKAVGKNLMDHLVRNAIYALTRPTNYTPGALEASYKFWKEHKKGPLSTFPFSAIAYARLEKLRPASAWRDPMGLTSKKPNVEFLTECYDGLKQLADFPHNGKSCFSIASELANPRANPIVERNYLSDALDLEVLAEVWRLGKEIVMEGSHTRDAISGSWPVSAARHSLLTRDDWKTFMGKTADPLTVLDERLSVSGVKGLIVADTSVMPTLN